MTAREKLAHSLQGFFRSVSGSSDRELASEAIRLEKNVIDLVRGGKAPRRSGRPSKRPLVAA